MTLKPFEILQINATIIAGTLILLAISAGQQQNPIWQLGKGFGIIGWGIVLVFSISSLFVLKYELRKFENDTETLERRDKDLKNSMTFMIGGFFALIIFLGIYAFKLAYFSS